MRLTVQFQSVPETFPHDVLFSLTNPSELNDNALGAHTMLAPSAGSITSSSSSLRKQRLKDISEDAEEASIKEVEQRPQTAKLGANSAVPTVVSRKPIRQMSESRQQEETVDELPASALRVKALLAMRASPEVEANERNEAGNRPRSDALPKHSLSAASREQKPASYTSSSPPMLPPLSGLGTDFEKALPAAPENQSQETETANIRATEPFVPHELPRHSTAPELNHSPHLTAGASESISLWSSEVSALAPITKKKKLGPRPHVEPPGRPRTSGASENTVRTRPVANLPTSVKITTERARIPMSLRPSSQQSSKSVPGRFSSSQSVSNLPPMPSPSYYRPESRSVVGKSPSMTSEISVNATPEKIRLMRALQLRKRNMLANQRTSFNGTTPSNILIDRHNGQLPESSSHTPTTATLGSENAEESSFTSREEPVNRRGSLSSDTSSSITPKAEESEKKTPKAVRPDPSQRSEKREAYSRLAAPAIQEVDSDDEVPDTAPEIPVDSFPAPPRSPAPARSPVPPPKDSPPPKSVAKIEPPESTSRKRLSNVAARMKKGLSIPQPLSVPAGEDASGDSEAESFMDELANATVQEAKPVFVARTPVTPVMSAPALRDFKDTSRAGPPQGRSISSSYVQDNSQAAEPRSFGARSSSVLPNWPPKPIDQNMAPLTKKSSLGTGISKRIKALEVLSTRDSTSPPRQPVRDIPSKRSAFETFMKRSSFVMTNTSTDQSPPKKIPETASVGPISKTAGPLGNEPGTFTPAKGEAVSVTARIIRNDDAVPPSTAPGDLNLHRSPLIVEHEKVNHDGRAVSRGREPPRSPVKQEKGRFSFSSYRSMTQSASQPRLNTADSSSRLSSKSKMPRSMSDNSSLVEDKKSTSRAHRLMKRVSNLTGRKSNKNLAEAAQADFNPREYKPETIDERIETDDRTLSNGESLLHVVDIGDVNVQFPDTLLWKRRFMRIDDQGYLIFSPPANDQSMKSVSRKYHLSDIRTPTLPDLEREQIAWSVFLDMRDGSCIQCACESRTVQQQVLQSKS